MTIAFVLLVLLGLLSFTAWRAGGSPPPQFLARYGLTPACEPTGRTMTISGIEFVEIGPGCFQMGSDRSLSGWKKRLTWWERLKLSLTDLPEEKGEELPVHWVEFPDGFWIARTELTNAHYSEAYPDHQRGKFSTGDQHPVVRLSWDDAKWFCSRMERFTGYPIRLPSEAEWECAARAGSRAEFGHGDDQDALSWYGWHRRNSEGKAHEVGSLQPNAWGIFDLHGNASEWCQDTYHRSYERAPTDGSDWSEGGVIWPDGALRVIRGGSWLDHEQGCRSAKRHWQLPSFIGHASGFRPAFSLDRD